MFQVLVFAVLPLFVYGFECELCTFQVDESIGCVNQLLKTLDPVTLSNLDPCESCLVYGISVFSRSPGVNVCSKRTTNGGAQHEYRVRFVNLTMACQCSFPQNADELLHIAAETTETLVPQNCPADKEDEAIKSFSNAGLPPLNPTELLKLAKCSPLPVSNLKFEKKGRKKDDNGKKEDKDKKDDNGKKDEKDEKDKKEGKDKDNDNKDDRDKKDKKDKKSRVTREDKPAVVGGMYAQWLGAEVTFVSTTEPGSNRVTVTDVTLLRDDNNPITMWCDGPSQFKDLCECALSANLPTYLMVQAIHLILPCRVDDESKKQHDIVDYFKCDE